MTQIEQTIEENLQHLKILISKDEEEYEEEKGVVWEHYKGVIIEMMKSYAEDVCIGMLRWMDSSAYYRSRNGWENGVKPLSDEQLYRIFTESEGEEE